MDKMPARRMPEGVEFPTAKKSAAKKPAPRKIPTTRPKGTPAPVPAKPAIKKAPAKMTPQDAAMKKILEGKYGRIYG